mmetsp:Transcript_28844/g.27751  ORF Transcript_28844/g.27751 Transcript_28844/m.27751 type:complete len:80 (+) Transcript_28844:1123-1362(+)
MQFIKLVLDSFYKCVFKKAKDSLKKKIQGSKLVELIPPVKELKLAYQMYCQNEQEHVIYKLVIDMLDVYYGEKSDFESK